MTSDLDGLDAPAEGALASVAAAAEAAAAPPPLPAGAPPRRKRGRPRGSKSRQAQSAPTEEPSAPAAAEPDPLARYEEPVGRLLALGADLAADLAPGGGTMPDDEREALECMRIFGLACLAKYAPDFAYVEEAGFVASVAIFVGLRMRRAKRARAETRPRHGSAGLGENTAGAGAAPAA